MNNNIVKYIFYLFRFLFFIIFLIMYYYGYILNLQIIRIICIVIFLWLYIYFKKIILLAEKEQYNQNKIVFENIFEILSNKNEILLLYKKKLIKLILFYRLINPVFWLFELFNIELKIYNFFLWLNYKFINYYWIRNLIYIILFNFIINPILMIYFLFYKLLNRWQNIKSLWELLFKRIEGLIFYLLLFQDFYLFFFYFYKNYIFYFILLFYLTLVFLTFFEKNINKLIKDFNLNIKNIFISRKESTILYKRIRLLLKLYRDVLKSNFNGIKIFKKFFLIDLFEIEKKDLFYEINIDLNKDFLTRIVDNKPSFNIYINLYFRVHGNYIFSLKYAYFNFLYFSDWFNQLDEEEKLEVNKQITKDKVLENYNIIKEEYKFFLFFIWEIENYIGQDVWKFFFINTEDNLNLLEIDKKKYDVYDYNKFTIDTNNSRFITIKEQFERAEYFFNINKLNIKFKEAGNLMKVFFNRICKNSNEVEFLIYKKYGNEYNNEMLSMIKEFRKEWEKTREE